MVEQKSMFQILVKHVNSIIILLFTTFIVSFFIIEYTLEYQDIKKNLQLMNHTNKKHLEEMMNNVTSYNEIVLNSINYHLLNEEIINRLIDSNPFIDNLTIFDYENQLLYDHKTSSHNDQSENQFQFIVIPEESQYYFEKLENGNYYVVYKTDPIILYYQIDKRHANEFVIVNQDYNYVFQDSDGKVFFSNINSPKPIDINQLHFNLNELVTYTTVTIFGEDYYLFCTIQSDHIVKQLFLNSYLTFVISFLLLVISLIIVNRKIESLTNKPYKLFIHDMETMLDSNYKAINELKANGMYFEYAKILKEFKKICLYNDNEFKKVIEEYDEKLHLAVESNKTKSLFLANMSHEMRTPLNAIITYTQLCKNNGFQDLDKIKEYFEGIHNSSEILLQKINDILDLSKIEAKQFELHPKPTHFRNLVKEIYEILIVQAERKNIKFSYRIDPQIPKILVVDATRLKQVLINICNNAIKFTEKGFVKLEIDLFGFTHDSIVLDYHITDTGCGIPKDQIDKIFLPFVQIDNNNNRQVGTGLGLTISQDIIRLMGGEISVTSKENEGSIFSFTTIFKVCEVVNQDSCCNNEVSNELFEQVIKNRKILIAEDNIINQIVMKELFAVFKKNDIDFASDGLEAVNMVKGKKYDLIFMDIQMPKMSGIEATIAIRKFNKDNVPIIALTANAFTEQINEYISCGMSDFLPKPMDIQKLKKLIVKYLYIGE